MLKMAIYGLLIWLVLVFKGLVGLSSRAILFSLPRSKAVSLSVLWGNIFDKELCISSGEAPSSNLLFISLPIHFQSIGFTLQTAKTREVKTSFLIFIIFFVLFLLKKFIVFKYDIQF